VSIEIHEASEFSERLPIEIPGRSENQVALNDFSGCWAYSHEQLFVHNRVNPLSSKIIRLFTQITHRKDDKTSSFCKNRPLGLTGWLKVFTLRSSCPDRFSGGATELQLF
jgi:hypothetical protein